MFFFDSEFEFKILTKEKVILFTVLIHDYVYIILCVQTLKKKLNFFFVCFNSIISSSII